MFFFQSDGSSLKNFANLPEADMHHIT